MSIDSNKFRSIIRFRIGQSVGLSGEPECEEELQNVSIEFEKTVLSIGVGQMHYVSPRDFQGLKPRRREVEVALIDKASDRWVTRLFFNEFMGEELHDDVAVIDADEILYVISKVAGWDAYGPESFMRSVSTGFTKGH